MHVNAIVNNAYIKHYWMDLKAIMHSATMGKWGHSFIPSINKSLLSTVKKNKAIMNGEAHDRE